LNTARVALRLTRRGQGTTMFSGGFDWPRDNDVNADGDAQMTNLAPDLAKLQNDLTAITARVSEIQRHIAALNVETGPRYRCGGCGLIFKSEQSLAEHTHMWHAEEAAA
jgi:hypothetical protein